MDCSKECKYVRLSSYRNSINKFIKNRKCVSSDNEQISNIVDYYVQNDDMLLPVLLLTTANSQTKKHSTVDIQCYYIAVSILFLKIIIGIDKESFVSTYGDKLYYETVVTLLISSNKMLWLNMDSYPKNNRSDIFIDVSSEYNRYVSKEFILSEPELESNSCKPETDTLKWYIKDENLIKQFNSLQQVDSECFKQYVEKKIESLCKLTVVSGWIAGYGCKDSLNKVRRLAHHFTYMYKLYEDFDSIEESITNSKNNMSSNYVVNYGLQSSYELFMDSKRKFIEDAMILDVYTSTLKEIVNFVDRRVDETIDSTTPDIKSNCSNII